MCEVCLVADRVSEVEGDSTEVGAKVMYQGREMTVMQNLDYHGNPLGKIKMRDLSGIAALSDALKTNLTLTALMCACSRAVPSVL